MIDDEALEGMTRRARDPDTGEVYEVPADMTYRQWMAARKLKTVSYTHLTGPRLRISGCCACTTTALRWARLGGGWGAR